MSLRRTKILATLGPATDKPGVLESLFDAGVDVRDVVKMVVGEYRHIIFNSLKE